MGWITAVLASDLARKALGLLLAFITIILFLLNLRRTGERTGRLAERLQSTEQAHDIQRQKLDAAARRPRDALIPEEELRRLRLGSVDGAFGQFGHGRSCAMITAGPYSGDHLCTVN